MNKHAPRPFPNKGRWKAKGYLLSLLSEYLSFFTHGSCVRELPTYLSHITLLRNSVTLPPKGVWAPHQSWYQCTFPLGRNTIMPAWSTLKMDTKFAQHAVKIVQTAAILYYYIAPMPLGHFLRRVTERHRGISCLFKLIFILYSKVLCHRVTNIPFSWHSTP